MNENELRQFGPNPVNYMITSPTIDALQRTQAKLESAYMRIEFLENELQESRRILQQCEDLFFRVRVYSKEKIIEEAMRLREEIAKLNVEVKS